MGMALPNLFIVGAGKAGTFSLYEWLRAHPDIYMSKEKEPTYFGLDLEFRVSRLLFEDYCEMFDDGSDKRYRGEASVRYLMSKTAAQEIHSVAPDSKIIIVLRNPVDVMHARWSQNVYMGVEPISDFALALNTEQERKQGMKIPLSCPVVSDLYYSDWVRYTDQVKRYYDVFGRGNVFVGLFDDLKSEPMIFYKSILEFLKLDMVHIPDFNPVNSNRRVRSSYLHSVLTGGGGALVKSIFRVFVPRKIRPSIKNIICKANVTKAVRKQIDKKLEARINKQVVSDLIALERLIDRDLSKWGR